MTALSQIVCPTSATTPACFALGTNSSGGVILSATISGSSPHTVTWTQDTTPSFTSFSQLSCPELDRHAGLLRDRHSVDVQDPVVHQSMQPNEA